MVGGGWWEVGGGRLEEVAGRWQVVGGTSLLPYFCLRDYFLKRCNMEHTASTRDRHEFVDTANESR